MGSLCIFQCATLLLLLYACLSVQVSACFRLLACLLVSVCSHLCPWLSVFVSMSKSVSACMCACVCFRFLFVHVCIRPSLRILSVMSVIRLFVGTTLMAVPTLRQWTESLVGLRL